MEHSTKKRKSTSKSDSDLCVICGKYEGEKRKDRTPTPICTQHQNHTLVAEFIQVSADFLQSEGVKARMHCSQSTSRMVFKNNNSAISQRLVAALRKQFHQQVLGDHCSSSLPSLKLAEKDMESTHLQVHGEVSPAQVSVDDHFQFAIGSNLSTIRGEQF